MSSRAIIAAILFMASTFPARAAADKYPVAGIPENLLKGASAVVRELKQTFTQTDIQGGVLKVTLAITILNEEGAKYGYLGIEEDDTEVLTSFYGEIISAQGKCVKKLSRSDLQSTQYSSALAVSHKLTFYENDYPIYPHTVLYQYEVRYRNNTLYLPGFDPVAGYRCSVEKSYYEFRSAPELTILYKNMGAMPEPEVVDNNHVYVWKLNNFESIRPEALMPAHIQVFPEVIVTSKNFKYQKTAGELSSWETFGVWQNSLLDGRDVLPEQVADKVKAIAAKASDEKEKVKLLYEYMQSTTRYVSIQLGIGGWQPMPAAEVAKTGFGDCKALSNYMRAMLSTVGIPSFYTIIRMGGPKGVFRDFPSLMQFNHVILTVPIKSDTLYLECTSQTLPFGFIHRGIAGHDAWLIGDSAARIITLPTYADSLSMRTSAITMAVSPNASALIKVKSKYRVNGYDYMEGFISSTDPKKQADMLGKVLATTKPRVSIISWKENRTELPSLEVEYQAACDDYAKMSDSRIIVCGNPMRQNFSFLKSSLERKFDIELSDGYFHRDSINIISPEGYVIENIPQNKRISSPYGTISTTYIKGDKSVICIQTVSIKSGCYKASEYAEIKAFLDSVTKEQEKYVIFRKT